MNALSAESRIDFSVGFSSVLAAFVAVTAFLASLALVSVFLAVYFAAGFAAVFLVAICFPFLVYKSET